jgi:hypothetical protein
VVTVTFSVKDPSDLPEDIHYVGASCNVQLLYKAQPSDSPRQFHLTEGELLLIGQANTYASAGGDEILL